MLSAAAPSSARQISEKDGWRHIQFNRVPGHKTQRFPNRNSPNRIAPQEYHRRVTLAAHKAKRTTPVGINLFDVGLNGVPCTPGRGGFWQQNPRSGWQYEVMTGEINPGLDESHAHVQPDRAYHYHGIPTAPTEKPARADAMVLTARVNG